MLPETLPAGLAPALCASRSRSRFMGHGGTGVTGLAVLMPAKIRDGWADCDLSPIAVNHQGHSDMAQIMLRPEQLQLKIAPTDSSGCHGVVTERDFGGNTCTLTVTLLAGRFEPGRSLPVHCTGLLAPPVDSAVQLTTLGRAHVLKN